MNIGDLVEVIESKSDYYGQIGLIVEVLEHHLLSFVVMLNDEDVYYASCHLKKL